MRRGGKYTFPPEVILCPVQPLLGVQLFVPSSLKPFLLSFHHWIESEEAAKTKMRMMSRMEAGGCRCSWGRRQQQQHGSRLKHYLSRQKMRTTKNVQGEVIAHLQPDAFASPPPALLAALRTEQHRTKSPWPARCHRPCTTPMGRPLRPTGHACVWAPGPSKAAPASCAPASKRPAATPGHHRPPAKPTSPPRAEFGRIRQRALQPQGWRGRFRHLPPSSQIAFVKMDAGPSVCHSPAHPCVAGPVQDETLQEPLYKLLPWSAPLWKGPNYK